MSTISLLPAGFGEESDELDWVLIVENGKYLYKLYIIEICFSFFSNLPTFLLVFFKVPALEDTNDGFVR